MAELVDYRVEKGVAIFELNDPPANTYTYEMNRALDDCILRARMDDEVHVIVLRGAGEKFFSAGANIRMLTEVTPQFKYYFCLHANETMNRLEQTPKLVIAALNGHTVGGGLEIAMAADIRIARQGSGKIGLPEVSLGVLPGTGGTQRLARLVGPAKALEMNTVGDPISADDAYEHGLASRVVDDHELFDLALAWGRKLAAQAPIAVEEIKRVSHAADLDEGLAAERDGFLRAFATEDAREGIAAFIEKRAPKFEGK
jgi:enoyl-CoA hydratase